MWILIVPWNWTVAVGAGMFGQRSWRKFDETFINSKGKDVYNRLIGKETRMGAKNFRF